MIFIGSKRPYKADYVVPKKGQEVEIYSANKICRCGCEEPLYYIVGYEEFFMGKSQKFPISCFAEQKANTSFKEIAEQGIEHVEKERSPHRKTSTDPAKERIFTTKADF